MSLKPLYSVNNIFFPILTHGTSGQELKQDGTSREEQGRRRTGRKDQEERHKEDATQEQEGMRSFFSFFVPQFLILH